MFYIREGRGREKEEEIGQWNQAYPTGIYDNVKFTRSPPGLLMTRALAKPMKKSRALGDTKPLVYQYMRKFMTRYRRKRHLNTAFDDTYLIGVSSPSISLE